MIVLSIIHTDAACFQKPDYDIPRFTQNYEGYEGNRRPVDNRRPDSADSSPSSPGLSSLSDIEMLSTIENDVDKLNSNEISKIRYFSLAVVENRGFGEAILEDQRQTFKMILSMISNREIGVNPVAVDSRRLFYRINTDELGISPEGFDKIVADHYPFDHRFLDVGTAESSLAERIDASIRNRLNANIAIIRMDWWNAAALVPTFFAKFKIFPDALVNLDEEFPEDLDEFLETIENDDELLNGFRFYNSSMTRYAAAIELGISDRHFDLVLNDPEFSGEFNAFNNEGGKVPRGTFQSLYPSIMAKFRQDVKVQPPVVTDFLETADCSGDGPNSSCVLVPQREGI